MGRMTMAERESMMVLDDDPLWYQNAVIYQVHVKSFFDSDGDGIGDFRGLTEKLDYLQDLGVTALWVMPFYPSPLRDDGYDIADYNRVGAVVAGAVGTTVYLVTRDNVGCGKTPGYGCVEVTYQ